MSVDENNIFAYKNFTEEIYIFYYVPVVHNNFKIQQQKYANICLNWRKETLGKKER